MIEITDYQRDGEAAQAALRGFWHPNNPDANADMCARVAAAIAAARAEGDRARFDRCRAAFVQAGLTVDDLLTNVRVEERERCAKIAETAKYPEAASDWSEGRNEAADEIAAAIRSGL